MENLNAMGGMSPADVKALMNGDNNDLLGHGGGFLAILLLLLFGRNGFGGNVNGVTNETVLNAVNGNSSAISQLSTTLNCDTNRITDALSVIRGGVDKVSAEVGMSTERTINAIQAGNCQITNALNLCCCENQKAILNQTNVLSAQNATMISDMDKGFCNTNFNIERNTNTIVQAGNANTQRIIDHMNTTETAKLTRELDALRLQSSQTAQTLALKEFIDAHCSPSCPAPRPTPTGK